MGISWSAMRRILERENICDSLKGRIQYFATRYSKSHDQEGRVAIRLDGKEVFKSCFYDWDRKRDEAWDEINTEAGRKTSYLESGEQMELGALNRGGFDQYAFYAAFHTYQNSSIDESLISPDPVVRLFAIMDRRVGKRRLQTLTLKVEEQPEWLQTFYRLRLAADGVQPTKKS